MREGGERGGEREGVGTQVKNEKEECMERKAIPEPKNYRCMK